MGVVLADEGDGTRMVGLHMVDDEIVNGTFADDLADAFEIFGEEGHINGVNEGHSFVVGDEVGVIGYAQGKFPESFKTVFHAVVHADVVYFTLDMHHDLNMCMIVFVFEPSAKVVISEMIGKKGRGKMRGSLGVAFC